MTEGGNDQYRDQYREEPFPPAPAPPWADPAPASHQAPPYGQGQPDGPATGQQPGQQPPPGQQPGYGQQPGAPSGQQPAYGPSPGQQPPPWGQDTGVTSGQTYSQPTGAPSGQQPAYGQTSAMPAYGDQAYGQVGYGQPGFPPPYQQQPYGQSAWGSAPPGYGRPQVTYASWGARAGALLLDGLFLTLLYLPGLAVLIGSLANADTQENLDGTTTLTNVNGGLIALGAVLLLAAVAVAIWNQGWRTGSQGWSWGKQIVGIKLVAVATGQPPGGWTGIGRMLVRGLLGGISGGIYTVLTYLWPLWDEQNQSLDDKMLSTLVVRAR